MKGLLKIQISEPINHHQRNFLQKMEINTETHCPLKLDNIQRQTLEHVSLNRISLSYSLRQHSGIFEEKLIDF